MHFHLEDFSLFKNRKTPQTEGTTPTLSPLTTSETTDNFAIHFLHSIGKKRRKKSLRTHAQLHERERTRPTHTDTLFNRFPKRRPPTNNPSLLPANSKRWMGERPRTEGAFNTSGHTSPPIYPKRHWLEANPSADRHSTKGQIPVETTSRRTIGILAQVRPTLSNQSDLYSKVNTVIGEPSPKAHS